MAANRSHPLIAREGWVHIAVVVAVAIAAHVWLGNIAGTAGWLVAIFVIQFFRDPPRTIPDAPGVVVAPADGAVIALGPAHDPYLKRDAVRISIFMNVFNVHSNRIPVAGSITNVWYHPGSFVNAALDKASEANERNVISIRTDAGEDVVAVQVAGLIARRILCYVGVGSRVARGERYGFIRFGSRVDVYLPRSAIPHVALGDKVSSGTDIIAELVAQEAKR